MDRPEQNNAQQSRPSQPTIAQKVRLAYIQSRKKAVSLTGIVIACVVAYVSSTLFVPEQKERTLFVPGGEDEITEPAALEKRVEQEYVPYKATYNLMVNVPPGQLKYIKAQVRLTEKRIRHKQYRCRTEWIWLAAAMNPDGNFRTEGENIYVTEKDVDDIPTLIRKYNQYRQEYHGNK